MSGFVVRRVYDRVMALHGRGEAIARVELLLERVRNGCSETLLFDGEAGSGKSSLLEEVARVATGFRILRATALEAERELPYGVLHQLVGPHADAADDLPAPQAQAMRVIFGLEADPAPDRFLASVAVLGLLGNLAEQRPLLCLVDDVQWADAASTEALLFVAHRLEVDGIAMFFAARSGSPSPFAASEVPVLAVGPLDPDAGRAILEGRSGVPVAAGVADHLVAETGGNALALSELGTTLEPEQLAGSEPLPVPLPLGDGIEREYARRLATLPEAERTALLVVALLGDASTGVVLDTLDLLGIGGQALGSAERKGLLIHESDQIRFNHPLLRSAAHSIAPLPARRAAHRALAEVLREDPDRSAWQAASAAVGPDPAVAERLVAAAARARERGAPAIASAALRRAADLTTASDERAGLLVGAAELAWRGGRGEQALDLLESARRLGISGDMQRTAGRLQGTVEAWCGRPAQGCTLLCREAEAVATSDPALALELLAEAAEAASFTADQALSNQVGDVAERVAETGADPDSLLRRRLLVGTHRFAAGDMEAAIPMLTQAIAIGAELDEPVALNLAGRAAIYLGDEQQSLRLDRRAETIAREQGAIFTLPSILVRRAISEVWLARLPLAGTTVDEALRLARETGQEDLVACSLSVRAYVAAVRGDSESCRADADAASALAGARGLDLFADLSRAAVGQLELGAGRPVEALRSLAPISHPGIVLRTLPDRVEAAARAERSDLARQWVSAAEQWAELTGFEASGAIALHCRALISEGDEAESLLDRAIGILEGVDRPLELARSELELGRVIRRDRRRGDARQHLQQAITGFERIGAEQWAVQAASELRASGQTARRRDPTTLDELTPQEIQVGRLVAQGLTNREVAAQLFLSPRTIDFHLRNLFRKLGIKSRTQLARIDLE